MNARGVETGVIPLPTPLPWLPDPAGYTSRTVQSATSRLKLLSVTLEPRKVHEPKR